MKISVHSMEIRDKDIDMHNIGKGYKIVRKLKLHHITQALEDPQN